MSPHWGSTALAVALIHLADGRFGYDVADHCDVEPIFGTLADFGALIARAHALGLRVIIDQVYAHSSDQHTGSSWRAVAEVGDISDWHFAPYAACIVERLR
jgi:glycosidase